MTGRVKENHKLGLTMILKGAKLLHEKYTIGVHTALDTVLRWAQNDLDNIEYSITIDREEVNWKYTSITFEQLLSLAGYPSDTTHLQCKLFRVVPGGPDVELCHNEIIQVQDGARYYTSPRVINNSND